MKNSKAKSKKFYFNFLSKFRAQECRWNALRKRFFFFVACSYLERKIIILRYDRCFLHRQMNVDTPKFSTFIRKTCSGRCLYFVVRNMFCIVVGFLSRLWYYDNSDYLLVGQQLNLLAFGWREAAANNNDETIPKKT